MYFTDVHTTSYYVIVNGIHHVLIYISRQCHRVDLIENIDLRKTYLCGLCKSMQNRRQPGLGQHVRQISTYAKLPYMECIVRCFVYDCLLLVVLVFIIKHTHVVKLIIVTTIDHLLLPA